MHALPADDFALSLGLIQLPNIQFKKKKKSNEKKNISHTHLELMQKYDRKEQGLDDASKPKRTRRDRLKLLALDNKGDADAVNVTLMMVVCCVIC